MATPPQYPVTDPINWGLFWLSGILSSLANVLIGHAFKWILYLSFVAILSQVSYFYVWPALKRTTIKIAATVGGVCAFGFLIGVSVWTWSRVPKVEIFVGESVPAALICSLACVLAIVAWMYSRPKAQAQVGAYRDNNVDLGVLIGRLLQ